MINVPTKLRKWLVFFSFGALATLGLCATRPRFAMVRGEQKDAGKTLIGGRWYIENTNPPTYYYDDGERLVDLFSYHAKDSNKDGIPNLRLSHDDRFLIIESQGYPNHPTAEFPNASNPNSIRVQQFVFRLPLNPKLASEPTRVPMGPIGMAINGVVFFNPFEMGGKNAVEGYDEVWLDSCCGHPQQTGVYHYHKYPTCVKSPFSDDGMQHSSVIGFAFDGFPLYGPHESKGLLAKDLTGESKLDECNGHQDAIRGYHYHVTPGQFPYILGGYRGVPEPSNNRGIARAGSGTIADETVAGEGLPKAIAEVVPTSVPRGKLVRVSIKLDSEIATSSRVPSTAPTWVQFGPFEAKSIQREGNKIQVDLEVSSDADLGNFLDCHIEFENNGARRGPIVIKQNDALQVTE